MPGRVLGSRNEGDRPFETEGTVEERSGGRERGGRRSRALPGAHGAGSRMPERRGSQGASRP